MSEGSKIQHSCYYQHVLQDISGESPCGQNLEYDADFIMLQSKLQPKQDVEYGDFVETAEPINWTDIENDSFKLLKKSKDIRLIITLMRCRLRQIGLSALHEGLLILEALLDNYPDNLHPQLVDEGEFEPLMRANAIAELDDTNGFLADFRNQLLPKASGLQVSIRDFEKAISTPREESALTEATLSALFSEWNECNEQDITSLNEAYQTLSNIKKKLRTTLHEDTPDFTRLENILSALCRGLNHPLEESVQHDTEHNVEQDINEKLENSNEELAETDNVSQIIEKKTSPKECKNIGNRGDAIARIREIRSWFTTMEPSSPIILLLELAENSAGKSFAQLLKNFPSETIANLYFKEE